MYRSCGLVSSSYSRNFFAGTKDNWAKLICFLRQGRDVRHNNLWCYSISIKHSTMFFLSECATYCAHVLALALVRNACPLVQARNNESAQLNKYPPLSKQTSESEQQDVYFGQTRTFISKMPKGLSRFPVDFNMALWTVSRGKLTKANTQKYGPPLIPPLTEDSKSLAERLIQTACALECVLVR